MTVLYNEIDPFAAAWLRWLIAIGEIAPGVVDTRSVEDLPPSYLMEFTQVHLFAGIGVWSYALRCAGWRDDQRIWSASCPCQPFSEAGKGAGFDDERHLWPAVDWLIEQCQPAIIIGEQVSNVSAWPWIDLVQADVERMGYAFGCLSSPAASVGAPIPRHRVHWVAKSDSERLERISQPATRFGSLAVEQARREIAGRSGAPVVGVGSLVTSEPTNSRWSDADWLQCRDDRWRPVQPGTFPLVDGAASDVGRLRGYGNAINADHAIAFIQAALS